MAIDSTTRIEAISSFGPEPRHMLPSKKHGDGLRSHQEAGKPAAGNIAATQEIDNTLLELSKAIEQYKIALKFTRDEETGTIVIEVIDQTSGDTLLQFPNEARLHIAATLSKLQGKIFNCQA